MKKQNIREGSISSPQLKARKKQRLMTKRQLIIFLTALPFVLLLGLLIISNDTHRQTRAIWANVPLSLSGGLIDHRLLPSFGSYLQQFLGIAHSSSKATETSEPAFMEPIRPRSLTVLLPVTSNSILELEAILIPLLSASRFIHEIVLSCSEAVLPQARVAARRMVSTAHIANHLEISLHPWFEETDGEAAVMHIALETTTEWILILDESGLLKLDSYSRKFFLRPTPVSIPTGPRGITKLLLNVSCVEPSGSPRPASYLLPPFFSSSDALKNFLPKSTLSVWVQLGNHIARQHLDEAGGMVVGSEAPKEWCPSLAIDSKAPIRGYSPEELLVSGDADLPATVFRTDSEFGVFALIFPNLSSLQDFSSAACRLQKHGHMVYSLIYSDDRLASVNSSPQDQKQPSECRLIYDIIDGHRNLLDGGTPQFVQEWLKTLNTVPDILVALKEEKVSLDLHRTVHKALDVSTTHAYIPLSDLRYSEWMGGLSLKEWTNWNAPRIDISVITKDRPRSLERLLMSLSNAKYFGDVVNIKINLEQSADLETKQMVDLLKWEVGGVSVHHRVIHGGLLLAVAESWYPHSNHSYGLILEDDVELSPWFYSWIKMTILKYRYGKPSDMSPQLFGISLYQQKNIELKPEGRRPFNARSLFLENDLPYPATPYLSQIPCSWGAVYFPEHWREFHDYLAIRFSEQPFDINVNVVPNIRSNRWTKSWKKYFNELVYLRGYAMLYPNYDEFVSLSTNHLEIGSHVKDGPRDVYFRRKEHFLLPLMPLHAEDGLSTSLNILDLPNEELPLWNNLPLLNLTGHLTSFEVTTAQGRHQRNRLVSCPEQSSRPFEVYNFLCLNTLTSSG